MKKPLHERNSVRMAAVIETSKPYRKKEGAGSWTRTTTQVDLAHSSAYLHKENQRSTAEAKKPLHNWVLHCSGLTSFRKLWKWNEKTSVPRAFVHKVHKKKTKTKPYFQMRTLPQAATHHHPLLLFSTLFYLHIHTPHHTPSSCSRFSTLRFHWGALFYVFPRVVIQTSEPVVSANHV